MISLIRKSSRNCNFSTAFLAASRRKVSRYTTTSRQTSIPRFETKSRKPFAYLESILSNCNREFSTEDKGNQDFNASFSDILRDLHEILSGYELDETSAWLTNALEYNLRNAEQNLVLLTVLTFKKLVKADNLNCTNMRLAHVLGWCTEMINTVGLMLDDIMDNSAFRRGQPCWYTLNNLGLNGINDALLINSAIYALLKKNFEHLGCYLKINESFLKATFLTLCGQNLDIKYAKMPVSSYNMKNYNSMAVNKAGRDNFYLPFDVAAQLAGFTDVEALRQSRVIIREIGLFFQIQNDFLDCFGNLETAGKLGTDIQDHRCTWLTVTCMERATDEQKQIMLECYGNKDPEMVRRVKELYKDMDLPGVYADYEEMTYNNTKALIKQTSNGVPHEIFLQILNKIYRRNS